jgi:hypothetical protein
MESQAYVNFYHMILFRRGEVILDFDIIDGWYVELERMNEGMTILIHLYDYLVMLKRISIYHIDKHCCYEEVDG